MAITNVNYDFGGYYDDFDETKNYHRIMFRPGFAVQARELTQLQTALQSQIDKLGQYSFKDGDRVLNGKLSLNVDYKYIKLENTHSGSALTNIQDFIGTTITGSDSGVTAEVINAVAEGDGDPFTLYVKYTNSGTNKETQTFAVGEVITSDANSPKLATVGGDTGSSIANAIGVGSALSIEEGVYFISGCMVHIPSETIILDKYTNTPNYIAGLSVSETIVSSADAGHSALVDNAGGTTNESAPGATRYLIDTTLIKQAVTDDDPAGLISRASASGVDKYIHLTTIVNGKVILKNENPVDTEFSKRLETRTSEESGDYVISPFILDIKEHLNANNNNGYLTSSQGGDADKIAVGIEPSIAYIDGRRIEKISTQHVVLDKPRQSSDLFTIPETTQSVGYGNYVLLHKEQIEGIPDIDTFSTVNLKNINSGAVQGTARIRDIEFNTDEDAFRCFLFDIQIASSGAFGNVDQIHSTGFQANFAPNQAGKRYNTAGTSLVYPLAANAISTLKDGSNFTTDINFRVRIASGTVSGGSVSVSISDGTLASDDDIIVYGGTVDISSDTTDTVEAGTVASIANTGVGYSTFTLTGLTEFNGQSVTVICTVSKTNVSAKTKILQTNSTTPVTLTNGEYSLGVPDVLEIKSVVHSSGIDYIDDFTLDNGQRDGYYDIAKIIPKGGVTLPSGTFTVTMDYLQHQTGGDYFSVDSYASMDYAKIPSYKNVNLRDAIDFRPTKNTSGGFAVSHDTGVIQNAGAIQTQIKHYMGRIDKLFLAKDGTYKVVKGAVDRFPVEPENIENAIHLYTLFLKPYVFGVQDVLVTPIDNQRYTMRDIGKIEKRVKNLEYYSSLSLLEKSAAESQIFDSAGDSRFKNGFIVDGFYGHNVGDTSHPDYSISMDRDNGILRPKFDERSVNLIRKTGDEPASMADAKNNNKAVKSAAGGIVTMPYDVVDEINQPYSSYAEFVNPYNVIIWDGVVKLSPESDEWKEVDQRPDIIIDDNSLYDQFVEMAEVEGILGTVWNEWESNWTGREVTGSSTRRNVRGLSASMVERATGVANTRGKSRAEAHVTTSAVTLSGTETRTGIESYVASDIQSKTIGNYVVETNFIPFMRSRKIYFDAQLLKPNTKVYAFFNGVDVTAYCKKESSFVEFSDRTGVKTYEGQTSHPDSGSGALDTDATGRLIGSFVIPRNDALKFKTGTREFKITDSSVNNDELAETKAIENFHAQGVLETYQRTIVNTKIPRIAHREVSQSKAITKRTTETSYELVRYYDPIAETFVIKRQGGIFTTGIDLFFNQKDASIPIVISIREVENGYPTQRIVPGAEAIVYPGDITVSANASVGHAINWDFPVHLKEGVEYAIVCISNSDKYKVYVAETSKFDLTNVDYRITKQPFDGVFFTSANASTWTAEQNKDLKFKLKRAKFDTDDCVINLTNDELPPKRLGVNPLEFLSTSGGNTTIRVHHRNHGMYSGTHTTFISGVVATEDPGSTGSNTHLNGIQVVNTSAGQIGLNCGSSQSHSIINQELHHYDIVVTGTATTTGVKLGGTAVTATENRLYDIIKLNAQTLEFPEADINFELKRMNGKSMDNDGAQSNYDFDVNYAKVLPNKNTTFESPGMIASPTNKTGKSLSTESFQLKATLSNGGNDNLSPVIDLNRTSVITIQNLINDAVTKASEYTNRGTLVADTAPSDTSNESNYITKQVELNDDATNLDVYINVNRPRFSAIDVYYKVGTAEDNLDELNWVLIDSGNRVNVPFNDNNVYSEVRYSKDFTSAEPFNRFTIKVVLRSQRSSRIPSLRDFRAIATT